MNKVIKTIQNLRSVRDFSDKEINRNDMDTIIKTSLHAANASARQSYSMVIVENKDVMKELTGYKGSRLIVYCIDFNRLKSCAEYLNQPCDEPSIIDFMTGTVDTVLAVQTAVITARSLGIDSLITNGIFRCGLGNAYKILNLPERYCFPVISVLFGYCGKEPGKKKGRLSSDSVIHYGTYNAVTEERIKKSIEEYNRKESRLGLIDNWDKLGYANYLDWFFAEWMAGFKPENNIPDDKGLDRGIKYFYDILEQTGFIDPDYI